ncbi:MAG TPA: hypothetical protein P5119_00705 [Candidatus Aminicenantes bacterium]|nr:hypothetical protein [Candidatus Aminicenantes bacterium]HRY63843.1 hypothetical protein [Candidatus Aminicenantes bacterium]HRZ70756.1 hypothetical protein [Candidatus Aminicenantes bacterium]
MVCALCRWFVSRAEDSGKKAPRWVGRHLGRCRACGEYALASETLSLRLRSERSAWLDDVSPAAAGGPLDLETAGDKTRPGGAGRERRPRSLAVLRPLPIAAAALILIAAGLVLFRTARREPAPPAGGPAAARAAFERLAAAPGDLRRTLNEAESPLEREGRALEQLVVSAADYLGDRLNVRIERKGAPKDL